MTTPYEVATWMLEELKRQRFLYQNIVVYDIESKFGDTYSYLNENGNQAINREVLVEFRKITENFVVWDRREKCWRFREEHDSKNGRLSD